VLLIPSGVFLLIVPIFGYSAMNSCRRTLTLTVSQSYFVQLLNMIVEGFLDCDLPS